MTRIDLQAAGGGHDELSAKNRPSSALPTKAQTVGLGDQDRVRQPWRMRISQADLEEVLSHYFEERSAFSIKARDSRQHGLILCQAMTLRFYASSGRPTPLPATLAEADMALGGAFLCAYTSLITEARERIHLALRLEQEIPLALYRGALLGMLQGQVALEPAITLERKSSGLIGGYRAWLRGWIGPVALDSQGPLPRDGEELWRRAKRKVMCIQSGEIAPLHRVSADYWLEKLDCGHHDGKDHSKVLFPRFLSSDEADYFVWLDGQRMQMQGRYPLRPVAYLDDERSRPFLSTLEAGRLVLSQTFPPRWREEVGHNDERLAFTVDPSGRLFVAPKKSCPTGELHHCSFNQGSAVRAAGYLRVASSLEITEVDCESGHYLPSADTFRTVVRTWFEAGLIVDPEVVIKIFGAQPTTLGDFLGDDGPLPRGLQTPPCAAAHSPSSRLRIGRVDGAYVGLVVELGQKGERS